MSSWGDQPQGAGQASNRVEPFIKGKDGLMYFSPLEKIQYAITIPITPKWSQPLELWTHDTPDEKGNYNGNLPCRRITRDGDCEYCEENNRLEKISGRTLKNSEKRYPIKKKYIFPIIIEYENKPYLVWWKIYEKLLKQIAMVMGNGSQKLIFRRDGKGANCVDLVSNSGMPVDFNAVNQLIIDLPEASKEYFISKVDYSQAKGGGNDNNQQQNNQQQSSWPNSSQQQHQNQNNSSWPTNQQQQQQFYSNPPPLQQFTNAQQQPNNNPPQQDKLSIAKAFKLTVGAYAGKSLGELDDNTLRIMANNMIGDPQEYAVIILNSRGVQ